MLCALLDQMDVLVSRHLNEEMGGLMYNKGEEDMNRSCFPIITSLVTWNNRYETSNGNYIYIYINEASRRNFLRHEAFASASTTERACSRSTGGWVTVVRRKGQSKTSIWGKQDTHVWVTSLPVTYVEEPGAK